jgi:hypothetical protein
MLIPAHGRSELAHDTKLLAINTLQRSVGVASGLQFCRTSMNQSRSNARRPRRETKRFRMVLLEDLDPHRDARRRRQRSVK